MTVCFTVRKGAVMPAKMMEKEAIMTKYTEMLS
jgi:hypothetical protein